MRTKNNPSAYAKGLSRKLRAGTRGHFAALRLLPFTIGLKSVYIVEIARQVPAVRVGPRIVELIEAFLFLNPRLSPFLGRQPA